MQLNQNTIKPPKTVIYVSGMDYVGLFLLTCFAA